MSLSILFELDTLRLLWRFDILFDQYHLFLVERIKIGQVVDDLEEEEEIILLIKEEVVEDRVIPIDMMEIMGIIQVTTTVITWIMWTIALMEMVVVWTEIVKASTEINRIMGISVMVEEGRNLCSSQKWS